MSTPTCMNFLSQFYFLTPMAIAHGQKGKFGRFGGKQKGAITPKLEKIRPSKLICMRFRSTPTCMNFLSQFYFLTPMDYSPWSEEKIWPFWRQAKRSHNSETRVATPTKIGLHAFQVNSYLHEFFEPILFFDPHGL